MALFPRDKDMYVLIGLSYLKISTTEEAGNQDAAGEEGKSQEKDGKATSCKG